MNYQKLFELVPFSREQDVKVPVPEIDNEAAIILEFLNSLPASTVNSTLADGARDGFKYLMNLQKKNSDYIEGEGYLNSSDSEFLTVGCYFDMRSGQKVNSEINKKALAMVKSRILSGLSKFAEELMIRINGLVRVTDKGPRVFLKSSPVPLTIQASSYLKDMTKPGIRISFYDGNSFISNVYFEFSYRDFYMTRQEYGVITRISYKGVFQRYLRIFWNGSSFKVSKKVI